MEDKSILWEGKIQLVYIEELSKALLGLHNFKDDSNMLNGILFMLIGMLDRLKFQITDLSLGEDK